MQDAATQVQFNNVHMVEFDNVQTLDVVVLDLDPGSMNVRELRDALKARNIKTSSKRRHFKKPVLQRLLRKDVGSPPSSTMIWNTTNRFEKMPKLFERPDTVYDSKGKPHREDWIEIPNPGPMQPRTFTPDVAAIQKQRAGTQMMKSFEEGTVARRPLNADVTGVIAAMLGNHDAGTQTAAEHLIQPYGMRCMHDDCFGMGDDDFVRGPNDEEEPSKSLVGRRVLDACI